MDGCTVPSVIGTHNDEGCVEWVVERSHLRAGINSHTPLLWVEGPMLPKSVTGGAEPTKGTKRISLTLNTLHRSTASWRLADAEAPRPKEDGNR